MDREQEEMQFLGVFDIYKEAYKIIIVWRKIFSQITLSLILPLSFIFLAHKEVSDILFRKLANDEGELEDTPAGTQRYNSLTDLVSSDLVYFLLFKVAYFTFFLIFSLLSTAAVVYTIACIYTAREVSFRKVMSVVPKVWKRLMVTFLCMFLAFFVYHLAAFTLSFGIIMLWALIVGHDKIYTIYAVAFVLLALYLAGLLYLHIIWQLASVVSVLEDACGIKAMAKSKALIRGKVWVTIVIAFTMGISSFGIQTIFGKLVVHGWSVGMAGRVLFGFLCLLLLFKLFLFGLVIQTVIYFVCKSYHHENIDKSALSDHLEVYLGEYVPLKSKDVQLEQYYV
ncbi:hypothetical protein Tsubulata_002099 [Turnera subulata]|uniref:Uncharacterized protein n=1 Tax=Turnera subulata TaxID=218843 RepID=A0A9Q0G201_9ROSI|nr:hypothetical protein Tsubulata_002099 [Turnera subulata]